MFTNHLKVKFLTCSCRQVLKISEKDISEEYNVSRTPVREVFIKLAQDDLLDIYPQRGSFISLIDMEHVEEAQLYSGTFGKSRCTGSLRKAF